MMHRMPPVFRPHGTTPLDAYRPLPEMPVDSLKEKQHLPAQAGDELSTVVPLTAPEGDMVLLKWVAIHTPSWLKDCDSGFGPAGFGRFDAQGERMWHPDLFATVDRLLWRLGQFVPDDAAWAPCTATVTWADGRRVEVPVPAMRHAQGPEEGPGLAETLLRYALYFSGQEAYTAWEPLGVDWGMLLALVDPSEYDGCAALLTGGSYELNGGMAWLAGGLPLTLRSIPNVLPAGDSPETVNAQWAQQMVEDRSLLNRDSFYFPGNLTGPAGGILVWDDAVERLSHRIPWGLVVRNAKQSWRDWWRLAKAAHRLQDEGVRIEGTKCERFTDWFYIQQFSGDLDLVAIFPGRVCENGIWDCLPFYRATEGFADPGVMVLSDYLVLQGLGDIFHEWEQSNGRGEVDDFVLGMFGVDSGHHAELEDGTADLSEEHGNEESAPQ